MQKAYGLSRAHYQTIESKDRSHAAVILRLIFPFRVYASRGNVCAVSSLLASDERPGHGLA